MTSRFHAVLLHQLAHRLYRRKWFLGQVDFPVNRFLTGIIHGANQQGLFIIWDRCSHRKTAEIGDNIALYQGVGGTGKEKGKRHPTIGNNVVISTGAKVLGNITIGNNVKVGAGSVVLRSVPDNCTVVGVPGKVVVRNGKNIAQTDLSEIDLRHDQVPDPVAEMILCLQRNIERLERRIEDLEGQLQHGNRHS